MIAFHLALSFTISIDIQIIIYFHYFDTIFWSSYESFSDKYVLVR